MTLIFDSLFHPNAMIHANGGRAGHLPTVVRWHRPEDEYRPRRAIWYGDGWGPSDQPEGVKRVGILLEPREMHPENHAAAERWLDAGNRGYTHLFTHDPALLALGLVDRRIHAYPLGGTRLAPSDWRAYPKTREVSIIASEKRGLEGHAVRHEVIRKAHQEGIPLDAFGPEYQPVPSKLHALAPYRFSVISECTIEPQSTFFSEHLLDCFLTMTIPILIQRRHEPGSAPPNDASAVKRWGFDAGSVLQAETVEQALAWVMGATPGFYHGLLGGAQTNFIKAHDFVCTEDWLQREHPSLFDEDSE